MISIGKRGPFVISIGKCWPLVISIGRRGPFVSSVGKRGPFVISIGNRGPFVISTACRPPAGRPKPPGALAAPDIGNTVRTEIRFQRKLDMKKPDLSRRLVQSTFRILGLGSDFGVIFE